jgi:hypothetical protein
MRRNTLKRKFKALSSSILAPEANGPSRNDTYMMMMKCFIWGNSHFALINFSRITNSRVATNAIDDELKTFSNVDDDDDGDWYFFILNISESNSWKLCAGFMFVTVNWLVNQNIHIDEKEVEMMT